MLTKPTLQVIGSVNTMLKIIYGKEYTDSHAQNNVASIAFAGTVVGHLGFGIVSAVSKCRKDGLADTRS